MRKKCKEILTISKIFAKKLVCINSSFDEIAQVEHIVSGRIQKHAVTWFAKLKYCLHFLSSPTANSFFSYDINNDAIPHKPWERLPAQPLWNANTNTHCGACLATPGKSRCLIAEPICAHLQLLFLLCSVLNDFHDIAGVAF